jgi:hypothetical protein
MAMKILKKIRDIFFEITVVAGVTVIWWFFIQGLAFIIVSVLTHNN